MEKREHERERREFLARRRAQTLGERPHDGSPLQPHPDAPLATLSSSSRSISQHNDTSSSTDGRGNQDVGHTYNRERLTPSRLSEGVSDRIDGAGVGGQVPYQYPPTLRTRTRRSATIPLEEATSIWRPRHRQGLGVVEEDSPWDPAFNSGNNYFSDDDDDDNRTYNSSSSSSSTACSNSPTDSILKSSFEEGAGCLKPPSSFKEPQRILAPHNAGAEETYPNTPPVEEDAIPEREPEWDGMARSEPPFQPMFMGKHFDPRDPYRYGRGPGGRR
ncbi:hypothetical protein QBC45DRAFT_315451 [Copromyces sp. CBS 386.78]|nr:hypothetical protein QBC45DRAFT_315451 [Copromyces sp. CBS 386.78]